jgi:Mn-dependent DtxR family transcriptional regulator
MRWRRRRRVAIKLRVSTPTKKAMAKNLQKNGFIVVNWQAFTGTTKT